MHIEIELALEVVRAEFSKVGLVPDDDVRFTYLVEARPAGEECVYDGGQVFAILLDKLGLRRSAQGNAQSLCTHYVCGRGLLLATDRTQPTRVKAGLCLAVDVLALVVVVWLWRGPFVALFGVWMAATGSVFHVVEGEMGGRIRHLFVARVVEGGGGRDVKGNVPGALW
jgi:hypothetical protein